MRRRSLTLRFDPKVPKQLKSLPPDDAERILCAVERLVPWPPAAADVKALAGEFKGLYRLRVGNWRVQFTIDLEAEVLYVLSVLPRQKAYR